ncbi:hypothetical protein BLNAU_25079 [Blattamonas nauphoetae]|uniref:Calcineurin-like phosphoesterase domain-containing protein n=1 Tax=Blattamonas nauphoetae TaxID=2049346 RepID=A0ABQ9WKK1_9EUKA|nr:hypothetical protein BLNAU_25079 [Blattamonas nauphoetae]
MAGFTVTDTNQILTLMPEISYNFIYHRKKNKASNEIVLAFDTGDMIEGIEIFNIMKDIPYDGLVNGNHDIKYDKSVDLIVKTFQPAHAGKYGNLLYVPTGKKLGNNFRTISLGEGNGKILVLGFTYNIANVQKKVKVTGVAAFLNQEWFGRAMASKDTRAIVVLCHINTDHTHRQYQENSSCKETKNTNYLPDRPFTSGTNPET